MAEDDIEVHSTITHHIGLGFNEILLLTPPQLELSSNIGQNIHHIHYDVFQKNALILAVNQIAATYPESWLFYCYNSEYLFYPFCETRNILEMVTFQETEARHAVITNVIDLYAAQLDFYPNGVSLETCYFDSSGYYGTPHEDALNDFAIKERQIDCYGGLRWRFEEHIPWKRRHIDRVGLFKASHDVTLNKDYTLNNDEMNTYACPTHSNTSAAVLSFRTAKALRLNPNSRQEINDFRYHGSIAFSWHSKQLLELGFIEPGQWF